MVTGLFLLLLLWRVASAGAAASGLGAVTSCEDKREDCGLFAGRGPTGGGCQMHPEYMRVFCPRTCGLCNTLEAEVVLERQLLAGTEVSMISARGARSWRFFELPVLGGGGGVAGTCVETSGQPEGRCVATKAEPRTHAAMAHFYDSRSHVLNSSVYRWSLDTQSFVEHQAIPTVGAWDMSTFEVGGSWYLAVASFFDGHSRKLNSTIHRWDISADAFVLHQELPTLGAMDVEFFTAGGDAAFLVFTGNHDGQGECQLFRWNGSLFETFQVLETSAGFDAEAFSVDDGKQVVLAIVHELNTDIYSAPAAVLRGDPRQSKVDIDARDGAFVLVQSLDVSHGRDAEHFRIGGNSTHFVALAVFRDDVSYEAESIIYAWNPTTSRLEEAQRLRTEGAFDAELLDVGGESFLLVANQRSGTSHLYSWGHGGWIESEAFGTRGVYDVAWHHVREADAHYLGVARYWE